MSNKDNQIEQLLSTSVAPASNITKPLKTIGEGNMLVGVKRFIPMHWKRAKRLALLRVRRLEWLKEA